MWLVDKRYNNIQDFDFTGPCNGYKIIGNENGGNVMNNKVVKNVNGQVGEGIGFERIRRITGYLVGTLDRFNNGKRAEVEDRVKHGLGRN